MVTFRDDRLEPVATLGPYRWRIQAERAAARYRRSGIEVWVTKNPSRIYG